MEESRKAFEQWWEEWFGEAPLTQWDGLWCGDGYSAEDIDHMWDAWQASRAAIEIELPEKIKSHAFDSDFDDGVRGGHNNAIIDCAMSIRAAGIKVKE